MLREVAPDLWVAEEPLRYLGFEMGRRMAVIRLTGGDLLVHSPVPLSSRLRDELAGLGEVRFVVPASILHGHLYMLCFNIGPEWPLRTRLLAWGPRMRPRLGPTVAFRLGIRDREAARHSVERILDWDFDRILPGHGEIVETGGKDKFKRDFAWLLR